MQLHRQNGVMNSRRVIDPCDSKDLRCQSALKALIGIISVFRPVSNDHALSFYAGSATPPVFRSMTRQPDCKKTPRRYIAGDC